MSASFNWFCKPCKSRKWKHNIREQGSEQSLRALHSLRWGWTLPMGINPEQLWVLLYTLGRARSASSPGLSAVTSRAGAPCAVQWAHEPVRACSAHSMHPIQKHSWSLSTLLCHLQHIPGGTRWQRKGETLEGNMKTQEAVKKLRQS